MSARKIRFAFVGCGFIANKHAQALRDVSGAELYCVCDSDLARAQSFGATHGVRAFPNFSEMIKACASDIDVVSVLTPTGYHLDCVYQAASTGKHVVLEKPMAISVAEAEEIIDICERYAVQLFVVKQNRFNRPIEALKSAITQGRFGKFVLGTARVRWKRDASYYSKDAWRGTTALDGGVLTNQASHHLDLLHWLLGDVDRVQAMTARRLADVETEDTAVGTMLFKNGALGAIEATTGARPADLEASISVMGEGGSVVIEGYAANEVRTWQFADPYPSDTAMFEEFRRNPEGQPIYAHTRCLQNVVDSILGIAEPMVDGYEGLKTMRLIEALYGSAKRGGPIEIQAGRVPLVVRGLDMSTVGANG